MNRIAWLLLWVPALAPAADWVDVSATSLPVASLADRSMDVQFGDADGDGDLDAFVAKEFAPNLLLRNDGAFGFSVAAGAIPTRNEDSEDIALADFDRDGDLDVVFCSEDTFANEYYLNDGQGRFSAAPGALPSNLQSNAVIAGDLDRDGDVDLVLSSNTTPEKVLLNDGAGRFADATAAWMPAVVDVTQDLKLVDVDGDADLDLVAGNEPPGRNRLYLNDGTRFLDESAARLPLRARREETRKVAFGDIDGDGDADLVFGNVDFQDPSQAGNRVLVNDGSGRFADESEARLPPARSATLDVILEDIDGDADLDLIVANFGIGLQVQRNDGRGHFAEATAEVLGAAAAARNTIGVVFLQAGTARYLYEAGFNVTDRLLRQETGLAPIDVRYSGAFYQPSQSGHGFNVSVLEDLFTVAWFTFDRDGRSMFVTAAAPLPAAGGRTVEMTALRGSGMPFGSFDRANYRTEAWGTLRWTATDCDHAVVEYDSALPASDGQPFGRGRIELVRLLRLPGLDCR